MKTQVSLPNEDAARVLLFSETLEVRADEREKPPREMDERMPHIAQPTSEGNSVSRRPVSDSDFAALWRLHVETMKEYVTATYGWDDSVQVRMFREGWESRRSSELLEEEGDIVATWKIERRGHEHYLAFIEVAAAHQSRGHGTSIVRELVATARNAGVPNL